MRALITGLHGQLGLYLHAHLLVRGYEVFNENVDVVTNVHDIIHQWHPDEIYHLAGLSRPGDDPVALARVNMEGTVRVLEAVKGTRFKVLIASSAARVLPDPYALSKRYVHDLADWHRAVNATKVSTAVLHNHTSPHQSRLYLPAKIAHDLAHHGRVILGNLYAKRDWSHAADAARALPLILEQQPQTFDVCSGETRSVLAFVNEALTHAPPGENWSFGTEARFKRTIDPELPPGNPQPLEALGWQRHFDFPALVADLMEKALDRSRHSLHAPAPAAQSASG